MSGEELKIKLQEAGIPLVDVASRLDMSQQNLSAGLRVADVKTGMLERICAAFNLPMSFFYPSCAGAEINNVYNRDGKDATGSASIDASTSSSGVSDDVLRLVLQQNSELLSMLKEKQK